jgi:hypothetical protein
VTNLHANASGLVDSVTRKISRAGKADEPAAQAALLLARQIESGGHPLHSTAAAVAQMRASLTEALDTGERKGGKLAQLRAARD